MKKWRELPRSPQRSTWGSLNGFENVALMLNMKNIPKIDKYKFNIRKKRDLRKVKMVQTTTQYN